MTKENFTISVDNYNEWIEIQKYMFQQNVCWFGEKFQIILESKFPLYILVTKKLLKDDNYYMAYSTVRMVAVEINNWLGVGVPEKIIKASTILRKYKLKKLST